MVISFHFGTEAAICPLEQLPCVAAPAADDVTTVAMYLAGLRILWFCFNVCFVSMFVLCTVYTFNTQH